MDDMNIIIGQQQIESLDIIINILKNKNREDKIETIKKSNIQKSVAWCEKYKIPCNRFLEKINIFLQINNESKETKEIIESKETKEIIESNEIIESKESNEIIESKESNEIIESNEANEFIEFIDI